MKRLFGFRKSTSLCRKFFSICLITKLEKYSKVICTVDGIEIHIFDSKYKAVSMVTDRLQIILRSCSFHNDIRLHIVESYSHFEAKKRCFSIKEIILTRKDKERWILWNFINQVV